MFYTKTTLVIIININFTVKKLRHSLNVRGVYPKTHVYAMNIKDRKGVN